MTLRELYQLADTPAPEGLQEIEFLGAASLTEAGPDEISFFADPRYLSSLKNSRAGAILVPIGFDGDAPESARLVPVADPAGIFARVLDHFLPPSRTFEPGVHPMAFVSPEAHVDATASVQPFASIAAGATIGARTVVGSNCSVGGRVQVGEDCLLHPNVAIGDRCRIGNRVVLHSGVVIGSDGFGYQFREGRQQKIPQTGIVQIDDDVEIGSNTSVDRARFGRTWIQEGTKIDNLVQIGHNVTIGRHCILCSQVGISGSTRLGNFVVLAGKVGVSGHIEIGDGVVAAAMSGIPRSIPAGQSVGGAPAIPMRDFKRNMFHLVGIGKLYDRVRMLEQQIEELQNEKSPA